MTKLRAELAPVLNLLLAASAATGEIALDAVGAALDTWSVSTEDIDALLTALEEQGREIGAPTGGAEQQLKLVVTAARALKARLTRRPTLAEVAAEAGITPRQALMALGLLRVMQR